MSCSYGELVNAINPKLPGSLTFSGNLFLSKINVYTALFMYIASQIEVIIIYTNTVINKICTIFYSTDVL